MKIWIRVLCLSLALATAADVKTAEYDTISSEIGKPDAIQASSTGTPRGVIRVGYVESEDYHAFASGLAGIGEALRERGMIDHFDLGPDMPSSKEVWRTLAEAGGGKLAFVPDMHFCMKSMDEADYDQFINSKDVDLVLVMGTVAGVYFTAHETKNDYMVFAAANPIRSGIVKSESERFKPNSYAYIDPSRFRRQIEIAHNIFPFKAIGVVYENSEYAYAYSGIDQLETSAEANGFSIVRLYVDESRGDWDDDRYYTEMKAAYRQLARQVDTLYITTATTADDRLPSLLDELYAAGVATVSQVGESQVRSGVVLGVTLDDPKEQGRFISAQLERYVDGVSIDQLDQVYEITPKFFLNYDAALRTGLQIPVRTWLMADEIYRLEEENQ